MHRGCSKNLVNIPCHLKVASRTFETLRSPFGLPRSGLRPKGDKKRPFACAQGDKKRGPKGDMVGGHPEAKPKDLRDPSALRPQGDREGKTSG